MGANQLNEKLGKVQSSSMKSSKAISEMTVEGIKKITEIHGSLANHVARNMQIAATNLVVAKTPAEAFIVMKGDGGTPFIEEWHQYQQSMNSTIKNYLDGCLEVNDEVYIHTKESVNEFFKLACQNAPDGMDALIKPFQSAINVALEGAEQVQALTKNYMHNLEDGIVGGGVFGKITDLMPSAPHKKFSKKHEGVKTAL